MWLCRYCAQNRQSAKLFLQSSKLGLPHPLTCRRVLHPPPPLWFRGGTLACGRGDGGSQFGRGDRNCVTLDINVLCGTVCVPQVLETRIRLVCRERAHNYFHLELCVFQLMKAGGKGGGGFLCVHTAKAHKPVTQ